jgi:hypothetical protein
LHAATPLLSVGDIMGSDSPEQPTKHIPLPVEAANASSISLPGGTAGWLWNLRSEQGYRAMPLSNSTSSTQHHRLG